MPDKNSKQPKQLTGKRFTKNDMIYFGEMVAHEGIHETDVALYFNTLYNVNRKEVSNG